VLKKLESMGVRVVLNSKVDQPPVTAAAAAAQEEQAATTHVKALGAGVFVGKRDYAAKSAGGSTTTTTVTAGVAFWAAGPVPNTQFLRGGDLESRLDEAGRVKVDLTYAVSSLPLSCGVFCIGDASGSPDAKAGWVTDSQAAVVAKNIAALAKAAAAAREKGVVDADAAFQKVSLKKGNPKGLGGVALMPMGPNKGVAILPFGVLGDGTTSKIKGKDLFTSMMAGNLNYKMDDVLKANAAAASAVKSA
jgi:pyruvate/2-oxoglutarate dehydrogenase complex dihydrolipoamide dehydrogenase (E3) component